MFIYWDWSELSFENFKNKDGSKSSNNDLQLKKKTATWIINPRNNIQFKSGYCLRDMPVI